MRLMMHALFRFSSLVIITALITSCARTHSSASLPSVSAPNTTNQIALRVYEKLPVYANAAKIKWAPIEMRTPLKVGQRNSHIPEIRHRLIALQDMQNNEVENIKSTKYDMRTAYGIGQFQYANGLKETRVIDHETLAALNITPAERYYELVKSMHEWAKYPEDSNSRYVQVNIPSFNLRLISHGQEVLHMRVIVGRESRPTPTLSSKITVIVFNPSWNVPETILEKDVIPGMRENPNYLKEHYDMRVYANHEKDAPEIDPATIDWQTATAKNFKYRVSALPSDTNPLGRVKFIFANEHDVYMHDTPEKSLFALQNRAKSSGCIRLENPMGLVEYFYADNSDLNAEWVNQYLSTHETKYIQLRNPLPVYITDIPAWVDRYGRVNFARDVYGRSFL